MTTEQLTSAKGESPRRGRAAMRIGTAITLVSVLVGLVSAVVIGSAMGRPLYETITSDPLATPFEQTLQLREGRYTVFQLVGRETTRGPVTRTDYNDLPALTPDQVTIIGPDGNRVPAFALGNTSESTSRGVGDVFEGMLRFRTPAAGAYRVSITTPNSKVIIAPAVGAGVRKSLPWIVAGSLSVPAFGVGALILIIGAIRRRRQPVVQPVRAGSGPSAGWYPAPDTPGRQRYWDGRAWTDQLH